MEVYVASLEVRALPGSEMARKELLGAFVYVYVPAANPEDALEAVKRALGEDRYELIDCEYVEMATDLEWDRAEDEAEATRLVDEARRRGSVVYGEFYCWESEEE